MTSMGSQPLRRFALSVLLAGLLVGPALGEGDDEGSNSVAAGNGVVVHGVNTKELAARFRQVDRRTADDEKQEKARELAELLAGDLDELIEDSQGIYLDAGDAAVLRTAALDETSLRFFREAVDDRAAAALQDALDRGDAGLLEQAARRNALSTHGPRLLVALADRHLARGRLGDAVHALEDLLRLWPAEAELPGVGRAAVVSRLAGLYAAHGDRSSVLHLRDRTPEAVLDAPSPAVPGKSLREELDAAAARPERGEKPPPAGSRLALVGERTGFQNDLFSDGSREIRERPLAVETGAGPLLLTRVTTRSPLHARIEALGPPATDAAAPGLGNAPDLDVLWQWPPQPQPGYSAAPFAPARAGDLLLFTWPSRRMAPARRERFSVGSGEPLHDLVAISLSAEGREEDVRGSDEQLREDGDMELFRLSFCGRPVVRTEGVGGGRTDVVYTTLIGHAEDGGATQLHVACFDLVPAPIEAGARPRKRLRLRWRRHVLDGSPITPARYSAEDDAVLLDRLAYPTRLVERYGRLYVGSNTGAVACLSARDGRVAWVETYDQSPSTTRITVTPQAADTVSTWRDVPAIVDGPYVHVAPRDAEQLMRYAVSPLLPSRSMLVDRVTVRGSGTAARAGTELGSLLADDVAAVRDGVAFLCGTVAPQGLADVLPQGGPLLAYRLRDPRPGESRGRIRPSQVPERQATGHATRVDGGLLFPTEKGIYLVPFPDIGRPARVAWTAPTSARLRSRQPDRVGNLVAHGSWVWSVTPSRVALFRWQ